MGLGGEEGESWGLLPWNGNGGGFGSGERWGEEGGLSGHGHGIWSRGRGLEMVDWEWRIEEE